MRLPVFFFFFFFKLTVKLGYNLFRKELERKRENVSAVVHACMSVCVCPRPCGGRIACRLDAAKLRRGGRGLLEAQS